MKTTVSTVSSWSECLSGRIFQQTGSLKGKPDSNWPNNLSWLTLRICTRKLGLLNHWVCKGMAQPLPAYENSSILRNCNKIQPWSLYKQSCWKIQVWNCIPILSFGFSFGNVLLGSFGGSRQVVWWINWWVGRFGFLVGELVMMKLFLGDFVSMMGFCDLVAYS